MGFKFEKLKIWQLALGLSGEISDMVKSFPKDELFILTSQIKRAADSVVLNIAEGSTLQSKVEFKRFLVIANRSALEVVACLYLSIQRKYINESIFDDKYQKYEKLVAMIQALIRSLGESDNS
ncbi:four helix bundle protein [Parafilimonas terrae]|uniref:Four helix bundle protein n=1 Tax=Parafilimonas terrae TaxID=1465490 RepID=A0A1I5R2G7_9BACT|nr:four helix bundle protein [Parafilimonas terrae]SFP52744.1 four helix bundle protein [Parafilimonas terrae]